MVDLFDRLEVMFQQENSSYKTVDYLDPSFQQKLPFVCDEEFLDIASHEITPQNCSSSTSGINDVWREKICEWSYQVIDHFDFSREVVSVSIHYLDRFLATRRVDKKAFQLAAMTTLFLAIKLFEPGRLGMQSMTELSRGYFSVDQMLTMELCILRSLSWRMHPPTAYSFGRHLLFLLPLKSVSMNVRHDVLELARFLTELSVIDYFFVVHRPSVVAYAALLNAMEDIPCAGAAISDLVAEVHSITHLRFESEELRDCRSRLRLLYAQGAYSRPTLLTAGSRSNSGSPVCVSYGCQPQDPGSYQSADY